MPRKIVSFMCLFVVFVACHHDEHKITPITIRLVENYRQDMIQDRVPPMAIPERTEWRFDHPPSETFPDSSKSTYGWEASTGISNLKIENALLTGNSTNEIPLLHFERKNGLDDHDELYSIELRMTASAGNQVSMSFEENEKFDLKKTLQMATDWRTKSTLVKGSGLQTYTLKTLRPVTSSSIRHIFIRPVDVAGAKFEIQSLRLIFRKEHLASISSGPGWQGLSQIYQETLVARTPEKIVFRTVMPQNAWLDLSIGTAEYQPVTFQIGLRTEGDSKVIPVMERTVTTPYRWEALPIDLKKYAGQHAELVLALASETKGSIGFWGAPAIRSDAVMPQTVTRKSANPPQGVILIWADTLRRDHLDVYGYHRQTAPHLTQMAAQGTLFKDHIVQGTWTKVSTPALMTSLYPTSNGVRDFMDRLPSSATTLAEVFHNAGYATVGYSSILFTGAFSNLHQGYDQLQEGESLPDQDSSKTARIYVDRLMPWLEVHRDVPFFVFLHVSDPHDPYKPYPPYDTMWADGSKAAEHEKQTDEVRKIISDPLRKAFGMPTKEDLIKAKFDPDAYVRINEDWYDGSIRGMDAEIARLMERIKTLGLEKKVAVVFVGDHGEEFLEHGATFHGQTVYGELTNTPLIMWSPGRISSGRVVNETVEAIDIMPTLLQMSNLPVPAEAQGKSLLPLIQAKSSGGAEAATEFHRPAITEKNATRDLWGPPPRDTHSISIVDNGWKLIHNLQRPEGKPEFELYDERKDPLNQHDLSAQHPDVVGRLSKELETWNHKVQAEKLKPDSETNRNMSPEEIERLRSLGYLQ